MTKIHDESDKIKTSRASQETLLGNAINQIDKFWSLVLKTAPIWVCLGGILLWRYLSLIGRTDLLMPSISDPIGLSTLLISFVIFGAGVILMLMAPSFAIVSAASLFENPSGGFLPKEAPRIALIPAGCALISLPLIQLIQTWWLPIPFLITGALFLWVLNNQESALTKQFKENAPDTLTQWGKGFLFVLLLGSAGLITIFPSYAFFFLSKPANSNNLLMVGPLLFAGGCIGAFTTLPGALYISAKTRTTPPKELAVLLLGTTASVVFFVFIAAPFVPAILKNVALEIGIRDNTVNHWIVRSDRYESKLFDEKRWEANIIGATYVISAYTPFAFSDSILLCPKDIDPAKDLPKKAFDCVAFSRKDVLRIPDEAVIKP